MFNTHNIIYPDIVWMRLGNVAGGGGGGVGGEVQCFVGQYKSYLYEFNVFAVDNLR